MHSLVTEVPALHPTPRSLLRKPQWWEEARTICAACSGTTGLSHLDSKLLNRTHRGVADAVYCHLKLHIGLHKHSNIFSSWQGYNQSLKRIRGCMAREHFPSCIDEKSVAVSHKTDLPNNRKKSGCCTFKGILKHQWQISHSPIYQSAIASMKDVWHYRAFHSADKYTRNARAKANTGQPKCATKG